jgi:uncharacterized membrane protein YcaP (DUF421 family)
VITRIFDHPDLVGAATIAAKTAVVYLFLVGGLRLLGKRELGQMNLADVVMIVVIGNAVQNAMINNDNTLGGGVVSVLTLLVLNRGLNELIVRSIRVERVVVGEPVLLVHDGVVVVGHLQREGITMDQLRAALREHGLTRVEDASQCVLEVDGTISVIPRGATVLKTRRHYKGLRLP